MKMQNANVEIITFNSIDVIATSLNVDDSTVQVIWLTPQSIINYNNMATGDGLDLKLQVPISEHPLTHKPLEVYDYYSYPGSWSETKDGYVWSYSSGQNTQPTNGIRAVAENDREAYQLIFDWLYQKSGL